MGLQLRPAHWVIAFGAVLVEAVAISLSWGREPAWDTAVYAVYALANVLAGLLILGRHPHHVIGRLLVVTGLLQAIVSDLGQGWALAGASRGWPGSALADLAANSTWTIGGALMAATFVLFPDGRRPATGRIWPWVLPVGCIGSVLLLAGWATGDQVSTLLVGGRNPLRSSSVPSDILYWVGFLAMASAMLLGALAMVLRMRQTEGAERQQLKWMVFAVGIVVAVLLPSGPFFGSVVAVRIADAAVLTALPLAALAAIWRYRLYDVEVIISRTVLYLAVTVLLGASFAVLIVGLGVVFGQGSPTATALATLVVALGFRPLRSWLQRHVDRWFDRGRYDAVAEVARFMGDLRAGRREPEEISGVITDAVARAGNRARPALVRTLQREAALAIEMVRLRAELRHQLVEVLASRRRIVEATEAERRRIERDLHDGAQQRLVSIGLALRHVQHELGHSAPAVTGTLDEAVHEVTVTIEDLRDIARGIRPGVLDGGLAPALQDMAHRAQLPVVVDVAEGRYPDEIETAAYFIACEGVTNAAKHARASCLELVVRQLDGRLVIRVSDDGVGGAELRDGGGLIGVSDRVAAHGGTFSIESEPGRGTTLVVELSCAS